MLKESLQYSAIDSLAKITVDIVSFSRVERYRDFLKDPEFFPQETVPYLICTFLNYLSEHIPNRKDSSSMNQVLVTAFNPFGGDSINPSAEVLRALPDSIGTPKTFKINPKQAIIASTVVGKKQMTVKAKTTVSKTGGATYQIWYKIKGNSTWKKTTSTKQSKVIKSLTKGKKYQVKIRAIKKVGTTTYYGKWSLIKTTATIK